MDKFLEFDGLLWRYYNGIIEMSPMVERDYDCRQLRKIFGRFIMVRWVKRFCREPTPIWFTVADRFLPLEQLSANTRSKVRRGLRNFDVMLVNRQVLQQQAYDVYNQQKRLRFGRKMTQKEFVEHIANLPSNYHFIIVKDKQTGQVVGYSYIYEYGDQVSLRVINILPQAKKRYASYAYFYRIGEIFLQERRKKLVILGMRSFKHHSQVHEFVQEKFGYRKFYVQMGVCLSFMGRAGYWILRLFRPVLLLLPMSKAVFLSAFVEFLNAVRQQSQC